MLREELRRRLLEDRGIYVKEPCDTCGHLLGPVRYTRRGEPGEWGSRECRGDSERAEIRKGGRPKKDCTVEQAPISLSFHAARIVAENRIAYFRCSSIETSSGNRECTLPQKATAWFTLVTLRASAPSGPPPVSTVRLGS